MKSKDPQWKKLYQALQKGRRLTALDCFKLCGTMNAWKRMSDVQAQTGRVVHRDWKKVGNKRIRVFFMQGNYC